MKTIQIEDETHRLLKEYTEKHLHKISSYANWILRKRLEWLLESDDNRTGSTEPAGEDN